MMKPHKFDPLSFVGGLFMTLVGLLFLLPRRGSDLIDVITGSAAWFWPIILLALGGAVLLSAIPTRKGDPNRSASQDR